MLIAALILSGISYNPIGRQAPSAPMNCTVVLTYGDSKTLSTTGLMQTAFKSAFNNASRCVTFDVTTPTSSAVVGDVGLARGGSTVAIMLGTLTADLAASGRLTPNYILLNLGANETDSMPNMGTWETNYGAIIDALHAKWAAAQLYVMRPWVQGKDADSDTLAASIATVVAARPAFAHLGPDERVFLKGADNGATYMADAKHPNAAGYSLTAAQWAAALGF
jgi:lysophospholipase L1-like esterase